MESEITNILKIAIYEMDNQVGIYKEGTHDGTGFINAFMHFGVVEIYGGFHKSLRLNSSNREESKKLSKEEWGFCANSIIEELAQEGYEFEIASVTYNNFTLVEIEDNHEPR